MVQAAGPCTAAELLRERWHTWCRNPGGWASASEPDGMQRECMVIEGMVTVPAGPAVKARVAKLGPIASSILPDSTRSSNEGHS